MQAWLVNCAAASLISQNSWEVDIDVSLFLSSAVLIPVSFLAFVADGLLGRTTGRNQPLGFADEGHVAVISHKDLLTCTAFRLRKKTNRKYRMFRFEGCELYVGYFPVSAQHVVFAAFFWSGGRQDRFAGGLLPSLESIGAMSMVWLVVRPMTLDGWPIAATGHGAPQKTCVVFLDKYLDTILT